jgi:hypothetical protein
MDETKKSPQSLSELSPARTRREVDLFEHGRRRAIESGAVEPQEHDIRALENHAEAVSRETHEEHYDPSGNAHDAARETEHSKVVKDRIKMEESLKFADAGLREAESSLSKKHAAGPKPTPYPLLVVIAAVVIALTMAPTFADRFLALVADDVLRILGAGVLGLVLGGLLTGFILFGHGNCGERPAISFLACGAGLLLALACGGIRLSGATEFSEVLFAVFLTIMEAAVVVLLEVKASSLRQELKAWGERKALEDLAIRERDSAKQERDRLKGIIEDTNRKIESHILYIGSRKPRFASVEEAITSAVKQVTDGYFAGIAENRGYLLGAGTNRRAQ